MKETQAYTTPAEQREPSNPTVVVQRQIDKYLGLGTIHLPEDYSVANALKNAWFKLQEVRTPDKQLAIHTCTRESITNALMLMCIQGLDPSKDQNYFIPYGQQLLCQRSYHGDIMLVEQRIKPGCKVYFSVVYEGDETEYSILLGRKYMKKNDQAPANLNNPIVAAYAGVIDENGVDLGVEYMSIERIQDSWKQSKTYNPNSESSTHVRFDDEMALRTVIRRRLKNIIKSSSDKMLADAIRRSDEDRAEAILDAQISTDANQDMLALTAASEDIPLTAFTDGQVAEAIPVVSNPDSAVAVNDDPYATPVQ